MCMHQIMLEEDSKSSQEHKRWLNSNMSEVIKKEVMKLLDAGIIYPISDSKWMSIIHMVSNKGGGIVVKNERCDSLATHTLIG